MMKPPKDNSMPPFLLLVAAITIYLWIWQEFYWMRILKRFFSFRHLLYRMFCCSLRPEFGRSSCQPIWPRTYIYFPTFVKRKNFFTILRFPLPSKSKHLNWGNSKVSIWEGHCIGVFSHKSNLFSINVSQLQIIKTFSIFFGNSWYHFILDQEISVFCFGTTLRMSKKDFRKKLFLPGTESLFCCISCGVKRRRNCHLQNFHFQNWFENGFSHSR